MRDFCKIFAAIRALIGPLALEQGWQNLYPFGPEFPENVSKKIWEYINEAIAPSPTLQHGRIWGNQVCSRTTRSHLYGA